MRLAIVVLCLSLSSVALAADKPTAEQRAELKQLKKKNKALKKELAEKQAEFPGLFDEITRAERSAGWVYSRTTAVATHNAVAKDYPAKNAEHLQFSLKRLDGRVLCPFGGSKPKGGWLIYDAQAKAYKRPK